ncbi:hypothetical protein NVP2275O_381 [Vibrio phage 2.275.O._10N.286.54.E11]|nr:hypothetical protein NVP2275O_381 [Vibrio phage 2.275.O._10N.286.54.E11]
MCNTIKCEICNQSGFKTIFKHLKNKHNLTLDEYREIFPNVESYAGQFEAGVTFFNECSKTHNNIYNYSESIFITINHVFTYWCHKCSNYRTQNAYNHRKGIGCDVCGKRKCLDTKASNREDNKHNISANYILKVKEIYKDYNFDYSKTVFTKNSNNITTYCNDHQCYFTVQADHHLYYNMKCSDCTREEKSAREIERAAENFIKNVDEKYNNFYDLSKVEYTGTRNHVIIGCPNCGENLHRPGYFLEGNTCCVRGTTSSASKESVKILQPILNKLHAENIEYFFDHNEYTLYSPTRKYDLVIPDLNLCVEYNGSAWHPDYMLSESEWDSWKDIFSGDSASEKMNYDMIKAKRLYDEDGHRTWMITPSNATEYVHLILKLI